MPFVAECLKGGLCQPEHPTSKFLTIALMHSFQLCWKLSDCRKIVKWKIYIKENMYNIINSPTRLIWLHDYPEIGGEGDYISKSKSILVLF